MNLKAGDISLWYENGVMRNFNVNQTEVLRMITCTLRDENWGTFDYHLENEKIEKTINSFKITYDWVYKNNETTFWKYYVEITGNQHNKIVFNMKGTAYTDFLSNRAGLCVLHPLKGFENLDVEIKHVNNTLTNTFFPQQIAPFQTFENLKSLKWNLYQNECNLELKGEVFETEDQRNWGDASFKTYCPPLHVAFPKKVKKGDVVKQKAEFSVHINNNNSSKNTFPTPKSHTFKIGISSSIETKLLNNECIDKLRKLNFAHYLIELDLEKSHWKETLKNEIENAKKLSIPLSISLLVSEAKEQELTEAILHLASFNLNIASVLLLSKYKNTSDNRLNTRIPSLKSILKNTQFGLGTNYNFTEINRFGFDASFADFISFGYDPQEHAFDDLTLLENTETVTSMVKSAKVLYNKPIRIWPVLFKRRHNPYATDPKAIDISLENQFDARQKTDFLAKWTSELIKNLSVSGVDSISLFRTVGELGILDFEGNEYPVYETLLNR